MDQSGHNLGHLTSNKRYDILDIKFINEGDKTECNALDHKLKDGSSIYLFCLGLTGNLKMFDNLEFGDIFDDYRCKYLNLWIYDRISKTSIKLGHEKYLPITNNIMNYFSKYNVSNKCKMYFLSYLNEDNKYNEMKRLYDYALNYKILKFDIDKNNYQCTEYDEKYINDSISLYNEINSECSPESELLHCVALREIREFYPNEELLQLKCKNGISSKPPHARQGQLSGRLQLTENRMDTHRHPYGVDGSFGILPQESVDQFSGTSEYKPIISNPHVLMAFIFPLLGVVLILFILYKFTPLGSLLYSRLLRIKRIRSTIGNDENEELLENSYYSMDAYTYNSEHQIGYHAARSS
ncbi:PIR Superfamily Protein [Plasmodium ovale wallikeri]|uniref:PIR Superfamily Protein n=1 Tax=Plasmodium ovale wallikeri TaxID=864142 RepID=A0A1A9AGY9_PLAOA|nr:PIR Superfamily Protein [Plasmodium ovale wallikeri]